MGRVITQVNTCSHISLKSYVSIGHILMMKVKDMATLLRQRKSRVYRYMEYWHDVYNVQL